MAEKIWYKLFGGEKRAFIHWYIVIYVIAVTHHEYHSIMHIFPIKLIPYLFARDIGELCYKRAMKISNPQVQISEEEFKKRIIEDGIASLFGLVIVLLLEHISGQDLIWLLM